MSMLNNFGWGHIFALNNGYLIKPKRRDEMYYVTMTDRVLSGWGLAKGKINKLIFICDNLQEARVVEANAKARGDMKYINIKTKKPSYPKNSYYTQFKTKQDYPTWYKPTWYAY